MRFRLNILESAAKGYSRMRRSETEGNGFVNRPAHITKTIRRTMQLAGNQTWFKIKPLTFTPQSQLKKTIQEIEMKLNGNGPTVKVQIIERAGTSLFQLIGNQSPWTKEPCSHPACAPCIGQPG